MDFVFETPQPGLKLQELLKIAFRSTLTNYSTLARAFLVPVLVWCFAFSMAFDAAYYSYVGKEKGMQSVWYLALIAFCGLLLQFLANWKIAQVSYAVSKTVLVGGSSVAENLRSSDSNRFAILKLSIFVLVVEFILSGCACLTQFLMSVYYDEKGPLWTAQNVTIAALQFVYYSSWFPHMMFYALNAYTLASATGRTLDFGDVVDHHVGTHLPSFGYFCGYVFAVTLPCALFAIPIPIHLYINSITQWSFLRQIFEDVIGTLILAPIGAGYFGFLSIAGAYLSKQRTVQSPN